MMTGCGATTAGAGSTTTAGGAESYPGTLPAPAASLFSRRGASVFGPTSTGDAAGDDEPALVDIEAQPAASTGGANAKTTKLSLLMASSACPLGAEAVPSRRIVGAHGGAEPHRGMGSSLARGAARSSRRDARGADRATGRRHGGR